MEAAYRYYEPITTHDSSLSPSCHSIIAAWIGNKSAAEQYFMNATAIDTAPEKLGSAEGIHIANSEESCRPLSSGLQESETRFKAPHSSCTQKCRLLRKKFLFQSYGKAPR
ncbi:hypothetical protein [Mesobacillus zeae]